MELIKLKLLDTDGMTLLTAPAAGQVSLVYMNAYKPGDRVSLEIGTPGQYVVIQFEDTMAPALVYVVKREINFHIPFGEQAITYSPKSFAGACHIIRARFATPEEIAAVDKRIVVHNGLVKKNGQIRFGAAEHISFVLLEAMKADPDIRCLIEFSAPEEFVENMEDAGLEVTLIRKREESIAETVRTAIASSRKFPDVLADLSNKKNVTIEVLGKTPADVLSKMDMVL